MLVTGATGFIGSHLCDRLLQTGNEVHGLSRKSAMSKNDVRWWTGDLSDFAEVRRIAGAIRPHYIFHLASEVTGDRSVDAVLPTFRSNLASTVNMLTAAAEFQPLRIVLVGSLEESETAESPACSPYAAAKWASSAYSRMFHALYQTPVVNARVFMVYGPGQRDLQKLIPYVTLSLLRNECPEITSGQRPVDWIYVADVVEGLIAAAAVPEIEGSTVELGSGTLTTVREIVETLTKIIDSSGKPIFGARPDRAMERVRCAQVAATYDQISWKPETSLADGLQRTVDSYQRLMKKCVTSP